MTAPFCGAVFRGESVPSQSSYAEAALIGHRADDEEFYQLLEDGPVRESIYLLNKKLRQSENYYNFDRPHGALDGQTPYERLLQKPRVEASPSS